MMRMSLRTVLLMAAIGLAAACSRTDTASGSSATTAAPAAPAAAGPVKIIADEHGYTPSSVSVAKGTAVTLEFVRTTDKTCATEVVFPDLNVNKPLPLNTPVDVAAHDGLALRTHAADRGALRVRGVGVGEAGALHRVAGEKDLPQARRHPGVGPPAGSCRVRGRPLAGVHDAPCTIVPSLRSASLA